MQRLLEILLGLEKGFLSREGDLSPSFNPKWPGQEIVGAATWNIVLGVLAIALVVWVYRREGRSRKARVALAAVRLALLAFVLALLNRPVLNLGQSRTEPSVLAIVMDNTVSMSVRDAGEGADGQGLSRFQAMLNLVNSQDQKLLKDLSEKHDLRFYRFDRDAQALGEWVLKRDDQPKDGTKAPTTLPSGVADALTNLKPDGASSQVLLSLRSVLQDLQGQRVAGVVLLTDGRSSPVESMADMLGPIKDFRTKVYPVPIGADRAPQNLLIDNINVQESAFVRDLVSVKAMVRGMGYQPNHAAKVQLKTKAGSPLLRSDGRPAEVDVTLAGDAPQEVELTFKPADVGTLDMVVEVVAQQGEVDQEDNKFPARIAVLDARISVLYCDGYPRWEYRYLKNEMMRDSTVDISCLLFSADRGFAQEGDKPITRFPESMTEMLAYDVVVFGDVDPRQFTDAQLLLVHDFVLKKGGGFGMVAGPKWSPRAFRNTSIESLLPVSISRVGEEPAGENITQGWRPVLTKEGANSTIFRFFEKKEHNEKFIRDEIQPLFWYCRGVTAKPNVGITYAEHPHDTGSDNRKAPILVLGRYGSGRTLFSGIDDSWRWRFYTGEAIFDTYWIQQLRYLALAKKLGERRYTLASNRPAYQRGEQIKVTLNILDPELQQQLPEQIDVEVVDAAGTKVRTEKLQRLANQMEAFEASWPADATGNYTIRVPALGGQTVSAEHPITVKAPRLELSQPQVDRTLLTRLAGETDGTVVPYEEARAKLPTLITSAARNMVEVTQARLWDVPLAMAIFVLLITVEWVLRKAVGLL